MKFFCEYCGNRIDADKDHKCPHCGASYKQNKKFIKLEEQKNKEQQINDENKQKIIKHVFGVFAFSKLFMIIPVIIFAVIVVMMIVAISSVNNENKNKDNNFDVQEMFDSMMGEESKDQEKVVVNFNEFAETKKYRVKVTKYEAVEDNFQEAEEGYELVKFHLIVENLSDTSIRSENVNCIVDGVAQNNDVYSGHSDLPFHIEKELAVKGTSAFFVPKDASSYDIRYGDYVTIHIEK